MLSLEVSSTIFWVVGMTRPGIEPLSPGPLTNILPNKPILISLMSPYNSSFFTFFIYLFLSIFFVCSPISILLSNFHVSSLEPMPKYNILYEVFLRFLVGSCKRIIDDLKKCLNKTGLVDIAFFSFFFLLVVLTNCPTSMGLDLIELAHDGIVGFRIVGFFYSVWDDDDD